MISSGGAVPSHIETHLCNAEKLGGQASCFKGIGKIKLLKLLLKSPAYCDILKQHLEEDWNLNEDLISGCEKFTCALYGKAKYKGINKVHHLMLKSKCDGDNNLQSLKSTTVDLVRLPPSRACLREHIARANHRTRI